MIKIPKTPTKTLFNNAININAPSATFFFSLLSLLLIVAGSFSTLSITQTAQAHEASLHESQEPQEIQETHDEQNNSELSQENNELPEIHFFYSETCPHCADQKEFHEYLLEKYPDLVINSYNIAKPETNEILKDFTERYDAEKYFGLVPLTFIGESYIVGFNTPETTGSSIELVLIKDDPGLMAEAEFCDEENGELCIVDPGEADPFGEDNVVDSENYTIINQASRLSDFGLDAENFSLPVLSVILGFLDGFNVCSLGALMLILSLVLTFKSRKKVLLFGGIFILITGITYAGLIFIWFFLFGILSSLANFLEVLIGILGLIGGFLFLRQYFRYKKYGPTCEISSSPTITKITRKIQNIFSQQRSTWVIATAIALFAFVVTVIEFPCSAVIPVAFAAILTDFGVGLGLKALYIGIFMFFYLLDEIIIFLIGVYTLRIWTGGQNMTTKLVLVQAILFLVIGAFYIGRLIL